MKLVYEGLTPKTAFNPETVLSNIATFNASGLARGITYDMLHDFPSNGHRGVLVICPGPSSREKMEDDRPRVQHLVEKHKGTSRIILAGGAVGMLYDGTLDVGDVNGVVFNNPDSKYELGLGPLEGLDRLPFYVATQCRPETFQALQYAGAFIVPWDAHVGLPDDTAEEDFRIGTGYGAAVGSIGLMSALGHRIFQAVGWDGYEDKQKRLAAGQQPEYGDSMVVEIDGQRYELLKEFGGDVPEFVSLVRNHPIAVTNIYLFGTGPTAAMINDNGGPRIYFDDIHLYNPASKGPDEDAPGPDTPEP